MTTPLRPPHHRIDFGHRRMEIERMDDPMTPKADLLRALSDLRWVNQWLGGTQNLVAGVERLLRNAEEIPQPLSVLDLGTGSADIPRALVRWGRRQGLTFHVTAVDMHPTAVTEARRLCKGFPEIQVVQADALACPMPDAYYDVVVSSLFLHHLDSDEAVRLLREMARLSRIGFVINDLERHPLAYAAIRALGVVLGKGPVFRNDAPLSVLRAFTAGETRQLAASAGLHNVQVSRQFPYRLRLAWQKPSSEAPPSCGL